MKTNNINILLVDDNQIIRETMKTLLSRECNYIKVIGECTDGAEVIPFLTKNPESVQVILMDINMKFMNGLETTKLLQQNYSHINIIGFSSHDEKSIINEMITAGAKDYIEKGSSIIEVIKVIDKVENGVWNCF